MINDQNIQEHYQRMRKRFLQIGISFLFSGQEKEFCYQVYEDENSKEYISVYIYEQYRGQNLYPEFTQRAESVITLPECGLKRYLEKKNISYFMPQTSWDEEYYEIEAFYKNQKAKRSGIPYINHIDEGLGVLHKLGASDLAKRAFCLHPIRQSLEFNSTVNQDFPNSLPQFYLADKYSKYANSLLRKNYKTLHLEAINNIKEEIFADQDLVDMLIADKIQNCKDFKRITSRQINTETYKEKESIENYFLWWLDFLEVDRLLEKELIKYIS